MKKKIIIKVIIFILAIIIGILIGRVCFNNYMKSKLCKILENNNSKNYELIEKYNEEETIVKVRDSILVSKSGNSYMWVNALKGKRVVTDEISKTAIITENDSNLKATKLNDTYINDYFENSNKKFKYIGKKDNYYEFEFEDKKMGNSTYFYLNSTTNIIEEMIEEKNNTQSITKFEVKIDTVNKEDVEYPDLTEYNTGVSASTEE